MNANVFLSIKNVKLSLKDYLCFQVLDKLCIKYYQYLYFSLLKFIGKQF